MPRVELIVRINAPMPASDENSDEEAAGNMVHSILKEKLGAFNPETIWNLEAWNEKDIKDTESLMPSEIVTPVYDGPVLP